MRGVTVPSAVRLLVVAAVSLVLVGGAVATAASDSPAPPVARVHLAALAPHGAAGPMTFQQISTAAQTCAGYAAAAGWANNGNYGGNLVTATAVCVAESGGNATIYYCDGNGTVGTYPPVTCPGGSYDRGLWQINSKAWPKVTDACAFQPTCNANEAYAISAQGATFSPWAVYDGTGYTRYLAAAQTAVNGLDSGALVSAAFGVCATRSGPGAGAAVVVGACGQSLPGPAVGGIRRHAAQRHVLPDRGRQLPARGDRQPLRRRREPDLDGGGLRHTEERPDRAVPARPALGSHRRRATDPRIVRARPRQDMVAALAALLMSAV